MTTTAATPGRGAAAPPGAWSGEARLGAALSGAVGVALGALAAGQAAGLGHLWLFSFAGALAAAAGVAGAAWLAGAAVILAVTGAGPRDPLARHAALPAGLALLAVAALALAAAGLLSRAALSLLVAVPFALLAARVVTVRDGAERAVELLGAIGARVSRPDTWLLAPPLLLALSWAALPPTFYDAVAVHLGLPNLYLHAGSLVAPEGFSVAGYPQYAEMISAWALALGGETAASLLNGIVAVAAMLSLRSLIERRLGRWPAALGTLFVATGWPFVFQAAFLKNDLLACFLLLTALRVLLESGTLLSPRRAGLAGALAGAAVGVKWLAGLPVLLMAPFVLRPGPRRAARLAAFALAAALVVLPWPVRNVLEFGNPVHPAALPLLSGAAHGDGLPDDVRRATGMQLDRSPAAIASRVLSIGWAARHGSGGEAPVLLLPVLLAGALLARERRERLLAALGLATIVLGVGFVTAYLRLFFLGVLLAGVAAAALVDRLAGRWRAIASAVLIAACAASLVGSVKRADRLTAGGGRVMLGAERVDGWLARQVNYVPLVPAITALPADARLLVIGSARTAYLPRRAEANYPWDEPWIAGARRRGLDHAEMTRELTGRGFTHVLLNAFDMDLLERSDGRFGHRGSEEIRAFYDGWFATLEPLAARNEAVLFRLPPSAHDARPGRP